MRAGTIDAPESGPEQKAVDETRKPGSIDVTAPPAGRDETKRAPKSQAGESPTSARQRLDAAGVVAVVTGALCVAGGLAVVLAWHLDALWLLRRNAADSPIVYNVGVAFVFTGAALVAAAFGRRRVVAIGASVAVVLSSAVLLQQVVGRSLGIDQLFFRTSVVGATSTPGRMTANIAVCLLAVGVALAFRFDRPTRRSTLLMALAAGLVAAFTGAAFAGYAAGRRSAYELGRLTVMALPAIALFLTLFVGLLALVWADLERSGSLAAKNRTGTATTGTHSMSVRKLLAVLGLATFVPLGLLSLSAITLGTRAVVTQAKDGVRVSATIEAQTVLARMDGIRSIVRSIVLRPAIVDALGDGTSATRDIAALQSETDNQLAIAPPLASVTITDSSGVLIAVSPLTLTVVGRDLSLRDWYLGASSTGDAYISEAVESLVVGKPLVVAIAAPIRSRPGGSIIGYMTLAYKLTAIQDVVRALGTDADLSLTVTDGHGVILASPTEVVGLQSASAIEPVRRALAGERGVISRTGPDGALFTGFAPVPSIGWAVLAEEPESSALDAVAPLQAAVGGIALVLGAILTITLALAAQTWRRRLEAETRLDKALTDLARSNAELEQFAYAASHDLSEPLRAISCPISLLARRYKGQLDDDADTFIGFAVDGCERMQTLIDGILALSRVGRLEGQIEPVDCNVVMGSVLRVLGPTIAETGATVNVDPLPVLPADSTQLSQVLQNLLTNALKFTVPGVAPIISVAAERELHAWRLTVTDNGIGIDPRHRERIFGMFKRLHGRDEYPGTGIGLALVKKIVERHGGSIGVENAPSGTGTRFWFTLPTNDDGTEPRPRR